MVMIPRVRVSAACAGGDVKTWDVLSGSATFESGKYSARLAPPSGGQIARLAVKAGDRVVTGQLLLSLWNDDLAAELTLAASEASAARARAEESCLNAQVTQREASRLLRLKQKDLVSEEQVDRAVTEAQARDAGCRAAEASAGVSVAKVTVAQAALERTLLKAPFDGVVGEVNGELGEYVTPSPPGIPTLPAVDLIDATCLYVAAPIDEVDAPAVRTGMRAHITLDAFAGQRFPGQVRRIAPYVLDLEKQARTVEIEVAFDQPEAAPALLPGYSADAEVVLSAHDDVVRVPTEAVLEGHRVLVYHASDGHLEERVFTAGLANWKYTEVGAGIDHGERICVSLEKAGVVDGALVTPETTPTRTAP